MTDIQAATESIVAATSHPVSVQLINQGAGIWGNVATGLITGLLTGGITLTGIWLTHYFTLKRERQASEDKMKKELHYIATELVFMLERYAEGCFRVVTDDGQDDDAPQPERKAVTNYPELNLIDVSGDWRTLEPRLMYRIRELPVLQDEAHRQLHMPPNTPTLLGIRTISGNGSISSRAWASTLSFLPSVCARQPGCPKHVLQVMMNGLQFPCFVKSGGAKEPCALLKLPATGSGIN